MGARFEVFRMEKLKNEGAVIRSVRHDLDLSYINDEGEEVFYRKTRDDEKEKNNQYCWGKLPKEQRFQRCMKEFRNRLPEHRRKNAVLGAQCIFSFSHELLEDKNFKPMKYFSDCQNFVYEHFGKENIFNWALHVDEKTPHITFQFVPKDEKGNLNARKIFGNKSTLSEWQDKFHREVGAKYNLDRGVKKTYIIHQTLDRFYGQLRDLDNDLENFELDTKNFGESWSDYFSRIKLDLKSFVEPMLKPLTTLKQQLIKFDKEQEKFAEEKNNFNKIVNTEIKKQKKILQEKFDKAFAEEEEKYSFSVNGQTLNLAKYTKKELCDLLKKIYVGSLDDVIKIKKEIDEHYGVQAKTQQNRQNQSYGGRSR